MADIRPEDWIPVELKCTDCGAVHTIYHTGESSQHVVVTCKCGHRIEWNFTPCSDAYRYVGFGMKASTPTPGPLAIASIAGRMDRP